MYWIVKRSEPSKKGIKGVFSISGPTWKISVCANKKNQWDY
jgi:hypothetical protein